MGDADTTHHAWPAGGAPVDAHEALVRLWTRCSRRVRWIGNQVGSGDWYTETLTSKQGKTGAAGHHVSHHRFAKSCPAYPCCSKACACGLQGSCLVPSTIHMAHTADTACTERTELPGIMWWVLPLWISALHNHAVPLTQPREL